jgi:hypothetical protein
MNGKLSMRSVDRLRQRWLRKVYYCECVMDAWGLSMILLEHSIGTLGARSKLGNTYFLETGLDIEEFIPVRPCGIFSPAPVKIYKNS